MNGAKPVKVALLSTAVEFGGAEKVVITMMKHMDRRRFSIVPVVFKRLEGPECALTEALEAIGIKGHEVHVNRSRLKYLNPVFNILDARKVLKEGGFDLIHTHGYRADVIGMFLSRLAGLPVISTCHGFIASCRKLRVYNSIDRLVLRYFDRVIAVSEAIRDELLENGVKGSRIEVILNAVGLSKDIKRMRGERGLKRGLYQISEEDFVCGYVGRLSPEKGVGNLIEAVSMARDLPLKVLIVGDGPMRKELEELTASRSLSGRVFFTGFQSDVDGWMQALDAFILPSLTEGTPMSLLEAMACAVPVIATGVGGVPKVVADRENGLLVPPANPEAIKGAMTALYDDSSMRERLGKSARETIASMHNARVWAERIGSAYLKALGKEKAIN